MNIKVHINLSLLKHAYMTTTEHQHMRQHSSSKKYMRHREPQAPLPRTLLINCVAILSSGTQFPSSVRRDLIKLFLSHDVEDGLQVCWEKNHSDYQVALWKRAPLEGCRAFSMSLAVFWVPGLPSHGHRPGLMENWSNSYWQGAWLTTLLCANSSSVYP